MLKSTKIIANHNIKRELYESEPRERGSSDCAQIPPSLISRLWASATNLPKAAFKSLPKGLNEVWTLLISLVENELFSKVAESLTVPDDS
jgi:hypothetical protein